MTDGIGPSGQKYAIFSWILLFIGIFALALGGGMFYFSSQEPSDVRVISATNYEEHELGSVGGEAVENPLNINTATGTELEELPGVGPVTAGKIIAGRPYTSVEELLIKKIVGRSTYEKISRLVIAP